MLLSVLIPTLESRRESLARLLAHLDAQRERHQLRGEVEILLASDGGQAPVGRKRNQLLDRARGEFVAFVDDDDEVSDDYLALICDALCRHPQVDCLGIRGIITFRGHHARPFIHSLRFRDYCTRDGTLCRPPYHLNPMRRAIAHRYRFAEVRVGEDIDWALRIRDDGALRSEHFIDAVLYYYHSRRAWLYQWLLDRTEPVRHALGLRQANTVRLRRGLHRLFARASGLGGREK